MSAGIIMVELPEMPPDSTELAEQRFRQIGFTDNSAMIAMPFEDGNWSYFAIYTPPFAVNDCKIITLADEPVAVLHGTDCNMVRGIDTDIRTGRQSAFRYCERRLAGGAFVTIAAPSSP